MIDIQYDRKEKLYKWASPDGQTFTFTTPEVKAGKAFQFAVSLLDPDLFAALNQVIGTHPQLERVAWKAAEIITGNGVEIFDGMRGNVYAMVDSSDGMGRYAISNEDGYTSCQCEHFQSFAAPMTESGNRYCKHILAYHLHLVTRAEY